MVQGQVGLLRGTTVITSPYTFINATLIILIGWCISGATSPDVVLINQLQITGIVLDKTIIWLYITVDVVLM